MPATTPVRFLQLLRQKLATGNRRSIYLDALPGRRANRLDIFQLGSLSAELPNQLLEVLLSQASFNLTLRYTGQAAVQTLPYDERQTLELLNKRLNNIAYENRDTFLETGVETAAIGYPILIKRDETDPTKIIKAPLLIWEVSIEKSRTHALQWHIRRNENHTIRFNELLLTHLEYNEGISLRNIPAQFLTDNVLSPTEVVTVCNAVMQQLGSNETYPVHGLAPAPESALLQAANFTRPAIRWSGVLGLFQTPRQAILNDLNALIKQYKNQNQESTNAEVEKHPDTENSGKNEQPTNETFDGFINDDIEFLSPLEDDISLQGQLQALIPDETSNTSLPPSPDPENSITWQHHFFSAITTDPSQQAVLETLRKYPAQLVQGPPGTGKSQLLVALITNALSQGATCLVVCDKRTALEVLHQYLQKIGLGSLCALIENITKDRETIVRAVREQIANLENQNVPNFPPDEWQKNRASELIDEVQAQHHFLAQTLPGNQQFTQAVGQYLQITNLQTPLLATDTDPQQHNYQFTNDEYFKLLNAAQTAAPLWHEVINRNGQALELLNSTLFTSPKPTELQQILEQQLNRCETLTQQALATLKPLPQQYAEALTNWFANKGNEQLGLAQQLIERINANIAAHGNLFNLPQGLPKAVVMVLAVVSRKHQQIKAQQTAILNDYQSLQDLYRQQPLVRHAFLQTTAVLNTNNEGFTFMQVQQNITAFLQRLSQWLTHEAPLAVKHLTATLAVNTNLYPALDGLLQAPRAAYINCINAVNKPQLLSVLFAEDLPAVTDQINALELLATNLQSIRMAWPAFRQYYTFKYFCLQQPMQSIRQTLQLLTDQAPATTNNNWQQIAQRHYLAHLLVTIEKTGNAPYNNYLQQELTQLLAQIQIQVAQTALHIFTEKQQVEIKNWQQLQANYPLRRLYNLRGSKGERSNSLRAIVAANTDLFKAFFPVLLVNPVVCSGLLPLHENLYDVVIFDEASQLRVEETFTALLRGRIRIISGDRHQMPPSSYFETAANLLFTDENTETEADLALDEAQQLDLIDASDGLAGADSLLHYADDMHYQRLYLDFHYRSRHPYLIDFSNAAFYGSRLLPMPIPQQLNYQPISFVAVNGLYHNQTNADEAKAVVHFLLYQLTALPMQSQLPSVGIATFNLLQRNLIIDLLEEARLADPAAAARLAELEQNGLFIKNLENIQGDERDIMLISTTYGQRADGKFLQLFGPLNHPKGYKLLNVLITRARFAVHIFTSIPETYYSQYAHELSENGITGRACLYAYLAYARATTQSNNELRLGILQALAKACPETDTFAQITAPPQSANAFIDWLAEKLTPHFEQGQIVPFYACGGMVIDIALLLPQLPLQPSTNTNENKAVAIDKQRIIALECDNAKQHQSQQAWLHDLHRQAQLQRMGFEVHYIYSAQWLANPQNELELLLKQLGK
ncbi:MAG: DUF4011 domain-containing protein [Sphingobacteriales bacterium]|jgi:hypothetical protein|nr:DUF4011 domain-containing protein [Sphingobacteriales bacterium]MBP9141139.1 DUF4011 domain-containing protein [Chitinophagales bacterium]MDA0198312.1 AAA domain-containing protein [Bacteroidota bacterium]MBK6889532.1 DUF4011 domain-containing protein [Sphingobacteriales bacterium]MBK7527964.1 DUF4011 domain-containing protein [Sphingobacteriales bacterium]